MSKMSELSMVIDEMITCGEGILKAVQNLTTCGERMIMVAKKLKDLLSTDNLPETKAVTVAKAKAIPVKEEPSETKNYSKEDVRGILSGKSASGYGKEVKALLAKYGADKLSALKPENYAAIAAEAEAIENG